MQIIGFQIDKPFLRTALLQKEKSGFKIISLKSDFYPATRCTIKGKGRQVSGLSSKDVMVRPIELNIGNTRHIAAALQFQSEGMTHLDPSAIISVPHAIKKSKGKVNASIFSASREAMHAQLEEFKKNHINLDGLSCYGLALIHYVLWRSSECLDAFIVDISSSEWTCVLMENGELKKSHALNFGTEELLAAFREDQKKISHSQETDILATQMDLLEIDPHLNPRLFAKLSEIRQEFGKVIFSFHRISDKKPIIFTGQANVFKNLKEFLLENMKDAISKELDIGTDFEEQKFAIPIGLVLEQEKNPLQLLREEFFPKKNWRQTGAFALTLMFLSICLSLFILYFGLAQINSRKKEMIESIQTIVATWNPKLQELLIQNEEAALNRWIEEIETHVKEYPYILDIPRASEVLSWLSRHPLLEEFQKDNDPFELNDLQYQLIEYPKIGSLKNRYCAKVDLQFRLKNLINARRFHEALLKGDKVIDSSKEINWDTINDGYKASFYLRPTTKPYVS